MSAMRRLLGPLRTPVVLLQYLFQGAALDWNAFRLNRSRTIAFPTGREIDMPSFTTGRAGMFHQVE